ncbi:uncharacterized protein IL334_002526 [Kwoniella shivajii]|uniref:Fungal lipase-type domain-containing protein n=1 Tax=Kwoniella shivajii TaxID=564305 RepID=A0ABZ1CVC3_9TREE|nr:hypothetical protein IL334_002526 [Kwoniella shivajii]
MIFSLTLLLFLLRISARPSTSPHSPSILNSPQTIIDGFPIGRTQLSQDDMIELGKLAIAVNSAYCPKSYKLQPHPSASKEYEGSPSRKNHRMHKTKSKFAQHDDGSSIVISSDDDEFRREQTYHGDMKWYISHTPSTQTLTLALSSLSSTDDLLELRASSPSPSPSGSTSTDSEILVPLPASLFPYPFGYLHPSSSKGKEPKIHHAYIPFLKTHGKSALLSLLDLIEDPPATTTTSSHSDVLKEYITSLGSPSSVMTNKPIRKIKIVGHGLGSAIGLLVTLALSMELSNGHHLSSSSSRSQDHLHDLEISTTLFGLPRVGNIHFARLVDSLIDSRGSSLKMNRITSYGDTITHLPERHLNLTHPSKNEIWIGPDPRIAYFCKPSPYQDGMESNLCAAGIKLEKTSLIDHLGPYADVWMDKKC